MKKQSKQNVQKSLSENSLLKQVEKEVRQRLKKAKGSHDFDHVVRVLRMAEHIGKKEKTNLLIVSLVALLHDLGRHDQDNSKGKVSHTQIGKTLTARMLNKHKCSKEIAEQVLHCIEAHSTTRGIPPETIEAKVLFDADKLDTIGAIGIGRAFLFAGEIGARLHNPEIKAENMEEYSKEDTAYREFLLKRQYVKDKMHTKEGKKIARSRHTFMVNFFKRLNKEFNGNE